MDAKNRFLTKFYIDMMIQFFSQLFFFIEKITFWKRKKQNSRFTMESCLNSSKTSLKSSLEIHCKSEKVFFAFSKCVFSMKKKAGSSRRCRRQSWKPKLRESIDKCSRILKNKIWAFQSLLDSSKLLPEIQTHRVDSRDSRKSPIFDRFALGNRHLEGSDS